MIFKNNEINKNPVTIHFNGVGKEKLSLFNNIEYNIVKPNDLTIITFATEDLKDKSPLLNQLVYNNIEFFNLNDYYNINKWNNLFKIKFLSHYLSNNNINTKYVLVLDSSDIILSEDLNNIIDKFLLFNKKILYGSTPNRYPRIKFLNEYDKEKVLYFKYLNAGSVIAETEYLKDFIKICDDNIDLAKNLWLSEQFEIRKNYALYDKSIIGYDSECEIFQNYYKFDIDINIEDNIVYLNKKE